MFMNLLEKFNIPAGQLALLAILSGLLYLFIFTLPFPLAHFYHTIPPVDYTKLTGYSARGFFSYVIGLGLLFGLYLWAIRLATPRGAGERVSLIRLVFTTSALFATILIFSYPLTAIDLFIYAIRSRGWALYGLNPLATAPAALPANDPWLGLAAEWGDAPSPYGPAWEILSLATFYLSGGDFLLHLFALKIIAALAYLGCVWLVYQILRQLLPIWAEAGTLAFAWNPLVLLESVQNAHNDIVMVFFMLAAIWVMNERIGEWRIRTFMIRHSPFAHSLIRHSLVCLFVVLSILIKFVTVLVAPFFLLAITARQKDGRVRFGWLGAYGLVIVGGVTALMWPLWPGWEQWAVLQAGEGAGRSLLALLVLALKNAWGVNLAFDLSRNFIYFILAGIYLYYLWQTIEQRPSTEDQNFDTVVLHNLCAAAFFVFFWYILLAAPVFHAWYLLWFLPLGALLWPARPPALRAAITFSITALLIIPYYETIRVWYPALLQNQLLGHLIGVPLLIIPPILALFWPIGPSAQSEVR
jgi:hypothetical protein